MEKMRTRTRRTSSLARRCIRDGIHLGVNFWPYDSSTCCNKLYREFVTYLSANWSHTLKKFRTGEACVLKYDVATSYNNEEMRATLSLVILDALSYPDYAGAGVGNVLIFTVKKLRNWRVCHAQKADGFSAKSANFFGDFCRRPQPH